MSMAPQEDPEFLICISSMPFIVNGSISEAIQCLECSYAERTQRKEDIAGRKHSSSFFSVIICLGVPFGEVFPFKKKSSGINGEMQMVAEDVV